MEVEKYLNLIDIELKDLPDYVNDYYIGTNLTPATTYQYMTEFRRFFTWLRTSGLVDVKDNKDIPCSVLEKLSRNDMMIFIDMLKHETNARGELNSASSINRSINALKSLFRYLTVTADSNDGEPYFYRNVMLKVKSIKNSETLNYRAHNLEAHMYTGDRKFEFLDFIENDYIQHCYPQTIKSFKINKERDMAIIALMLGTGIRVSEAASARVDDLNIKDKTLDVVRKGGQKDSVPIAPWTIKYLQAYLDVRAQRYHALKKDRALFLSYYHRQTSNMTASGMEKMVKKYSTKFGHPLTPHKLRHTLASELYEKTHDQVLVAQQLGQKGTSATDLYTHVNQNEQRKALDEISNPD